MERTEWVPKGWPATAVGEDGPQGWNILDRTALFPLMTLRESALRQNIRAMADYCAREGVLLAPHGKTSMSPELFDMQLRAGAWGITAATVWQVGAMRSMGCQRILLANVLTDVSGIGYVVKETAHDPGFEFLCYVDSLAGVDVMSAVLAEAGSDVRPIPVLVELGQPHGRTGARSIDEAMRVALAVLGAPQLQLAGIAGFEGLIKGRPRATLQLVDDFLAEMRVLVELADSRGYFGGRDEIIVTAGGSAYFDRVVRHLTAFTLSRPVRTVLRSGGYVTHDAEMYELTSPLAGRRAEGETLRLAAAFELWATVWSRPEPDLAILGFGKRDTSYDYGLPIPLRVYEGQSKDPRPMLSGSAIVDLNDQHAFLRIPAEETLSTGDLVVCGISHPCTAFERWKAIPVISDDCSVIRVAHTVF